MPMFFSCKHPFSALVVEKQEARTQIDADFDRVEYFFVCGRCGDSISLRYAATRGGVEAFLGRGLDEAKARRTA